MLESAWERRFMLLPMALAVTIFLVGAAGFVLTAGKPHYTQPVASLVDVVFAAPVPKELLGPPVALAPVETAPAPPPETALLAEMLEPAPESGPSVGAAAASVAVRVLTSPVAPLPTTSPVGNSSFGGFRVMQPPAARTTVEATPVNPSQPGTDLVEAPSPLAIESGGSAVVAAASNRQVVALATGASDPDAETPAPVILPTENDGTASAPSPSKGADGRGNSQASMKSNGKGPAKNGR